MESFSGLGNSPKFFYVFTEFRNRPPNGNSREKTINFLESVCKFDSINVFITPYGIAQ